MPGCTLSEHEYLDPVAPGSFNAPSGLWDLDLETFGGGLGVH